MPKKGGKPENFNNPSKRYAGTLGARVEPDIFEYVSSKPDKTEWLRKVIAEAAKAEMENAS